MREQLGGFFWLAISVFVCSESIKSEIGTLHAPGPGFLPFWSAVLLGIFAIVTIVYGFAKKQPAGRIRDLWKGLQWGKVIVILFVLFLYPLVLVRLGYLISTFGLMIVATVVMDRSRIWRHGISAVIIVVASYLLFDVFLDVKLPKGMFGF